MRVSVPLADLDTVDVTVFDCVGSEVGDPVSELSCVLLTVSDGLDRVIDSLDSTEKECDAEAGHLVVV